MKLFLASSLDKTISLLIPKISKLSKENRVIFIANAADPLKEKWWVDADRKAFVDSGFNLEEINLRNITSQQFAAELKKSDIIHICGGSVFYLLSLLQKKGIGKEIIEAVRKDKIFYTGTSAGSCIAAKSLEIFKFDPEEKKYAHLVSDFSGLNFVNFLIIPHCNNQEFIQANKDVIEHTPEFTDPLIFIQDSQAVWVKDDKFEILDLSAPTETP